MDITIIDLSEEDVNALLEGMKYKNDIEISDELLIEINCWVGDYLSRNFYDLMSDYSGLEMMGSAVEIFFVDIKDGMYFDDE